MTDQINPALTAAVRGVGRSTTPEDLQRRGVRRLRSVSMKEVADLIDQAVAETLQQQAIDVSPAVLEKLLAGARARVEAHIRHRQDSEDKELETHRTRAGEVLRRDLARLQVSPPTPPPVDTATTAADEQELRKRIRGVLSTPGDTSLPRGQLESKLVATTLKVVVNARQESSARSHQLFGQRTHLVQRRIKKVLRFLGEERPGPTITPRLRPRHRQAPGIPMDDPNRLSKHLMLRDIFESNQESE